VIDFPTSVNPTNDSAPALEEVPAPGMNICSLEPSEKVILSLKKTV